MNSSFGPGKNIVEITMEGVVEYNFESWKGMPYVKVLKYARWRISILYVIIKNSEATSINSQ